ncbi:hypothetical protein [Streptomyces sp. NPDC056949]|uniref:hypothetical protein n=1 Tax=Streptomyces sp. NPDC056949 TaxID=3345976 RepID=UPI00362D2E78
MLVVAVRHGVVVVGRLDPATNSPCSGAARNGGAIQAGGIDELAEFPLTLLAPPSRSRSSSRSRCPSAS